MNYDVSVKVKRIFDSLSDKEKDEMDRLLLERTRERNKITLAQMAAHNQDVISANPLNQMERSLAVESAVDAVLELRKRTGLSISNAKMVVRNYLTQRRKRGQP